MHDCYYNNICLVKMLTQKYFEVILQKNIDGKTGFLLACEKNNMYIIKFMICNYPECIY